MKFCYECGRLTAGDPLYCASCGRTYDVKLCPSRHANPRWVEVCPSCGSRNLSTPQPKVPFLWRLTEILIRFAVGTLLVGIALFGVVALFQVPQFQNAVVCLGILGGILWWLWTELPDWIRRFIRRALRRKEQSHDR